MQAGVVGPWIVGLVVALAAPVLTYIAAIRRLSGRIATSEASQLWEESRQMRKEYREQIDDLQNTIKDLRRRVADLEQENAQLRGAA